MKDQDESEKMGAPATEEPDQTGVTAEAKAESNQAAPENDVRKETTQNKGPGLIAFLALLLALLATAAAGFLWWQYREFYVALNQDDAELQRSIENVRASLRRSEETAASGSAELASAGREIDAVADQLDLLERQLVVFDQRIDTLQGGSFDAREIWLRAEAEYYLATANTELAVAGHFDNAIAALGLGDDLLRRLANPAFNSVRAAIADELLALRAVQLPDVEGLGFSLISLANRVSELPMRAQNPDNYGAAPADLDQIEPGFGRLWMGFKQAVLGIVRIERRDVPVGALLSREEEQVARRQLILELELARLALVRSQPGTFTASLDAAIGLLERDFDRDATSVVGATRLLVEMRRIDVAPTRPDISRSLNLVRSIAGSDDSGSDDAGSVD